MDSVAESESDLPIQPLHEGRALSDVDGNPGQFPFTRGVYPMMYTGHPCKTLHRSDLSGPPAPSWRFPLTARHLPVRSTPKKERPDEY